MSKTVGKIVYNPSKVLGTGATSTVYEGTFSGRTVAVKKIPKSQVKPCRTEIDLLIKLDTQKNIVRYFVDEDDESFFYIALEKCDFNIKDYVLRSDLEQLIPRKNVIKEIFEGFTWLHSQNIIHRDVKPSNILILEKSPNDFEVKISDLGLGKTMVPHGSQMSVQPDGTNYWTVPEMKERRYNIKSDIYSLGCLVYFIWNHGKISLKSDEFIFDWTNFDQCKTCDGVNIRHLITVMTANSPDLRSSVECLLFHPFFWSNEKILEFFINVSNRLEVRDQLSMNARWLFQEGSDEVINRNWLNQLEPEIRASLPHRNRMNYDAASIENLIRALRNKKNHYDDMSPSAKQTFGAIPDGYTSYWTQKFPKLLLHVYLKLYKSGLSQEENFSQFYPQLKNCTNNFK